MTALGNRTDGPSAQSRPLNICLLGYRSHPHCGGQGVYLYYLSKALVEAGHQVDVISGQPYPDLDPRVRLIKMPGLNLYEDPHPARALRPRHLLSWADFYEWFGKLSGAFAEPYSFGRRVARYLRVHGRKYDVVHDNQSLCYGLLNIERQGLPVVATPECGAADILTPGREGEVVKSGDVGAMTAALSGLVTDPVRRTEMGLQARARVGSGWGWDDYVERAMGLYEKVLA